MALDELEIIRKSLDGNQSVEIIHTGYSPSNIFKTPEFLKYFFVVAPGVCIYSVNDLNLFLDSLVPKLIPAYKYPFRATPLSFDTGFLLFNGTGTGESMTREALWKKFLELSETRQSEEEIGFREE